MQRRSRRSQPSGRRRTSPLRWLGWLAALLVVGGGVLMLLAPTLATRFIRSYLTRQEFRQKAEAMISAASGGETSIRSLAWNDDTVTASEVRLEHVRGWDAEATGVHASLDFGAIRSGLWSIQNVGADELTLRPAASSEPLAVPDSGSSDGIPSFLRSYIPSRVEIDGCEVERFSLEQGGWRIAESRLHAGSWSSGRTALTFKLDGGTLQMPIRLPEQSEALKLTIAKATLRASQGQVQLSDATLRWKDSAQATLRGSVQFENNAWQTSAQVKEVPVAEFLTAWWKQRLTGQLKGDLTFSGTRGTAPVWKGDAMLENGVLQGLPLLETLAAHTRVERFKRLVLDICEASFHPQGEALQIDHIIVQSNGLLRIEGILTLRGRVIDGDFMLGVTPETLRWIPGAQNRVFVLSNPNGPPGLHWTRVRIAGTLDAPQEDLSSRLIGGAGMALLFDTPGQLVNQGAEALLKPVLGEDAAKIPGKVMEGASGTLENGVKAGSDLLNKVLPLFPTGK
ncbi:MAG TPA: hypothetical protein VGE39_02820 [Prosthecobacter sp.]